jgi:hypothetical protein
VSRSAPLGQPSLKVPSENNRLLCVPSANTSDALLDANATILNDPSLPEWFCKLRRLGREQAIEASYKYVATYAPGLADSIPSIDGNARRLVVGGHQPELFHPGVWFKNFLMWEIGQQTDSIGMQVIVDHDVARSDALRVPTALPKPVPKTSPSDSELGVLELGVSVRSIPLPLRRDSEPRMPWHATRLNCVSATAWDKTIDQVSQWMQDCGLASPLIEQRRNELQHWIATNENIGDAFSKFRHRIEMDNGVFNLDVPISHLCKESAFGFFVLHCARNAESLWTSYNTCRDTYRARHGIRNQGQPVLELLRTDNAFELPFWIYHDHQESVERKRLWVQSVQDQIILSDHPDLAQSTVSVSLSVDENQLSQIWSGLREQNICVRPRALMTTMYLRCFVGDLFVHGIGGGTYDELTDDIIREWLGIDPPIFLTSSASLHLPFDSNIVIAGGRPLQTWHAIARELHLIRSVPERFLDPSVESQRRLLESHAEKLKTIPARGAKRQWHQEITQIKRQIEQVVEPVKRAAQTRLEAAQHRIQQTKLIKSREYSFVLFNEQDVTSRLKMLAKAAFQPTEPAK